MTILSNMLCCIFILCTALQAEAGNPWWGEESRWLHEENKQAPADYTRIRITFMASTLYAAIPKKLHSIHTKKGEEDIDDFGWTREGGDLENLLDYDNRKMRYPKWDGFGLIRGDQAFGVGNLTVPGIKRPPNKIVLTWESYWDDKKYKSTITLPETLRQHMYVRYKDEYFRNTYIYEDTIVVSILPEGEFLLWTEYPCKVTYFGTAESVTEEIPPPITLEDLLYRHEATKGGNPIFGIPPQDPGPLPTAADVPEPKPFTFGYKKDIDALAKRLGVSLRPIQRKKARRVFMGAHLDFTNMSDEKIEIVCRDFGKRSNRNSYTEAPLK